MILMKFVLQLKGTQDYLKTVTLQFLFYMKLSLGFHYLKVLTIHIKLIYYTHKVTNRRYIINSQFITNRI